MRALRVGLVCPYSLDVPGGVQNHVRDLAEILLDRGVQAAVLAPSESEDLPAHVTSAGRAVPVPYNGSVARVSFGPVALARTRRWLRDGRFDVLHVHEPATPSLALLALASWSGPSVATFHTAMERSRAMTAAGGILRPAMEKLSAGIAVSDQARVRVGRAGTVIVPNGIFVDRFQIAPQRRSRVQVCFLGRFDEPRKGLSVLLAALPALLEACPELRVVVVGAGDEGRARADVPPHCQHALDFVGAVDDPTRAALLAGSDAYVAPHTGGESFGIVLVEAMAAGTPVVASDLSAFDAVLEQGRWGELFAAGDPEDLTRALVSVLSDPKSLRRAEEARVAVRAYDWSVVADQVIRVYDAVIGRAGGSSPR